MNIHKKWVIRYLRDHAIALEVICTVVVILVWTRCYHMFEWISFYDSFYYTIITIAWVGYWDIAPITNEWKFIAIFLASLGMPLYLITASIIATKLIEGMKKVKRQKNKTIISKVKALIIEDNKILFLKENNNNTIIRDIPWWTIQYWERAENALIRRVIQEINVSIILEKSIWIRWWIDKDTGVCSLCHTYLAHINQNDKSLLLNQHSFLNNNMIAWVSIEEILSWHIDIENDSLLLLIKDILGNNKN